MKKVKVGHSKFENFLLISTKTGKKSLKIKCHSTSAWMMFEQRERAIGMLTDDMSARDVARHFQRHESTISRLLNRFQQTGNVADRPRSGRPHKTMPLEDHFLTTSSQRNRFVHSRKLSCLRRNATGTRICDGTVRNRLHTA